MSPPNSSTPMDDQGNNSQTIPLPPQNEVINLEDPDLDNIENFLRTINQQNNNPIHSNRFSLIPSDSQSDNQTWVSDDHDENFIEIDANLYMCLVNGKKEGVLLSEENLDKYKTKEEKHSVLHIAASSGQSELISDILPKCKDVMTWQNVKGDLAFHCAAKGGQLKVIEALFGMEGFEREILGRKNNKRDTVLHIALENNLEEMGIVLVDKYWEACYELNHEMVSPLYLSIKFGYWEIVRKMIGYMKENNVGVEMLLQGKSFVHAAIDAKNIVVLKDILSMQRRLIDFLDDEGRTPLSYAAFKGYLEGVQYILKEFPESAFKCNKDKEGSFPIHKAASGGNIKVINELYYTMGLLNRKDQNILHVAAASGRSEVVSYILKRPALKGLINLKDENGNTPLHLATKGFHPRVVYILTRDKRCKCELQNKAGLTALDMAEIHSGSYPTFEARLTWMALRYVDAPRSSQSTRKKYVQQNKIGNQTNKANDKRDLEVYKDRVDTHLLVATLVATVTFAAGFTLPGSYNQSDPHIGMAVLAHFKAFKVFVICNTAAFYSSILSVVTLIWAHMGDLKLVVFSLKLALPLLGFALAMMSLAFMMGLFVVLKNVAWLSYVILGMGSVFLFVVLVFFIPLYNPSYIRNSVVRFFFSGTFLLLLLVCERSTPKYA